MTTAVKWFWFASPQTFFPLAGTIARWSRPRASGRARGRAAIVSWATRI